MIRLSVTHLDAYGHIQFKIEVDGAPAALITEDPIEAAKMLAEMGVGQPLQLVAHARTWGIVEIVHSAKAPEP